jgi:hypothetical protein
VYEHIQHLTKACKPLLLSMTCHVSQLQASGEALGVHAGRCQARSALTSNALELEAIKPPVAMPAPRAFLVPELDAVSCCTGDDASQPPSARGCTAGSEANKKYTSTGRKPLSQAVAECVVHWFNTTLVEAQVCLSCLQSTSCHGDR